MPRTCTICSHPKRKAIEQSLVQGVSLRDIAGQFKTTKSTIERHQEHVKQAIQKAKETQEIKQGLSLAEQLEKLQGQTEQILEMFMGYLSPINGELALKAIDRRHKQIEIAARLAGEFKEDAKNPDTEEKREKVKAWLAENGLLVSDTVQ